MNEAEHIYAEAVEAGDLAAYVAKQDDTDIRRLRKHAEHLMSINQCKGGVPALVKWVCILEQAQRAQNIPNNIS